MIIITWWSFTGIPIIRNYGVFWTELTLTIPSDIEAVTALWPWTFSLKRYLSNDLTLIYCFWGTFIFCEVVNRVNNLRFRSLWITLKINLVIWIRIPPCAFRTTKLGENTFTILLTKFRPISTSFFYSTIVIIIFTSTWIEAIVSRWTLIGFRWICSVIFFVKCTLWVRIFSQCSTFITLFLIYGYSNCRSCTWEIIPIVINIDQYFSWDSIFRTCLTRAIRQNLHSNPTARKFTWNLVTSWIHILRTWLTFTLLG